jgi:hypothetical protein
MQFASATLAVNRVWHHIQNVFTKSLKTLSGWWRSSGRRFALAQWVRLVTGSGLGCVAAGLIHLFTQDSRFLPQLEQRWAKLPAQRMFDGVTAYRLELLALSVVLAAGIVPWLVRALLRYIRAWWSGMASLTAAASAIFAVSILGVGAAGPTRNLRLPSLLVALVAFELWRFQSAKSFDRPDRTLPKLTIPTQKRGFSPQDS